MLYGLMLFTQQFFILFVIKILMADNVENSLSVIPGLMQVEQMSVDYDNSD